VDVECVEVDVDVEVDVECVVEVVVVGVLEVDVECVEVDVDVEDVAVEAVPDESEQDVVAHSQVAASVQLGDP